MPKKWKAILATELAGKTPKQEEEILIEAAKELREVAQEHGHDPKTLSKKDFGEE